MGRVANKRSGFSIVEGLIVVLVIGLLGLSSWMVYQRIKTSATTTGASPNVNQQTTTQPAPTVAYLTIKEWGIKLPLSASIKDAYYAVGGNKGTDGLPNTMWLGLTSLNSSGGNATDDNSTSFSPIGSIIRVLPTDLDPLP